MLFIYQSKKRHLNTVKDQWSKMNWTGNKFEIEASWFNRLLGFLSDTFILDFFFSFFGLFFYQFLFALILSLWIFLTTRRLSLFGLFCIFLIVVLFIIRTKFLLNCCISVKTVIYHPIFQMFEVWIILKSWWLWNNNENYCFQDCPKSIYSQVWHFSKCIHKKWHLPIFLANLWLQNWLLPRCSCLN